MRDAECVSFLRECLPRMRLRWRGFRSVRGQVCKRLGRRMRELGIADLKAYRVYLEAHQAEWETLHALCRVTISRFYRDRMVFDALRSEILPLLAHAASAHGRREVRAWSAGCASGEEAYTLQIVWKICAAPEASGAPPLLVIATDADARLLERAREGIYPASALKDMPAELLRNAFDETADGYMIRSAYRENVLFSRQDIREGIPHGPFHIIMCRNFVFTYFEESLQAEMLGRIVAALAPGGFLVIGAHERLPARTPPPIEIHTAPCIFEKNA